MRLAGHNLRAGLVILAICVSTAEAWGAQAPEYRARTRQNYYTKEPEGQFMVWAPRARGGAAIAVDVLLGDTLIAEDEAIGLARPALVTFPLPARRGRHTLKCRFKAAGKVVTEIPVEVVVLRPRANAVKIDRFTGGLIVNDLPYFPCGFYCYSPVQPTLPEEEAVKGFNMMSPYQQNTPGGLAQRRAYMDRCAALGMKVHYQLLSIAGGGGVYGAEADEAAAKQAQLKAEIREFRDHPALLAWYIADEPSAKDVSPEHLIRTRALIRSLDPYHPVTVVFMYTKSVREYAEAMDIVMVDKYPVPVQPVTKVADFTRELVGAFRYEKPVWFVPQAFGGHEWWPREPTAQEERVMAYLPLVHGATGLQFFIRHGLNGFPKSTSAWAECGRVALELAELTPDLLSGEPRPIVSNSPGSVHTRAWRRQGLVTAVAVNAVNEPTAVELRVRGVDYTGKAELPFENRTVQVANGVIKDIMDGYGTRVYRLPVGPEPESPVQLLKASKVKNPSFEANPSVGTPAGCYARVGDGRGATYFVDSRVALHGRHSLRMTTPVYGEGCTLRFFPFELKKGEAFYVSIWAKADPLRFPRKLRSFLDFLEWFLSTRIPTDMYPAFELSLNGEHAQAFQLSGEWREYVLTGVAEKDYKRASVHLAFEQPGVAWFDALQAATGAQARELTKADDSE